MTINFDRRTGSGRTVADIVMAPLKELGVRPTVVDVGARNGMVGIADGYARRARFVGFEPNQSEYEKLVSRSGAAWKNGEAAIFEEVDYKPFALWDAGEERDFYVTAGPGACTLMGRAIPAIVDRMYTAVDGGKSYGERHTQVLKTVRVPCQRLDKLVEETIDYLKVDVEGAETRVFEGARALFERHDILFVKTEFLITPYFENVPLLGHQQVLLDGFGLRLLDLDFHQPRYARGKTIIPAEADRRLIYAGDAYFALDPDRNSLSAAQSHRLGAASLALGFNSFGIGLLRDAGLLAAGEIDAVERALCHERPRARFKRLWASLPSRVGRWLG